MSTKASKLTGKRFGKLTVIQRLENDKHGKTIWLCECDCGESTKSGGSDLIRGKRISCGCLQRTHGLSHHRTHNIFTQMKERCYNPENISYPWYGEQGIGVHQDWLDDYTKFYDWSISNGYADDLEIDRIDPAKNYNPENCRWVDSFTQARNRRPSTRNTSGVVGVKWNKSRRKWEVSISANNERFYLGLYSDLAEASEVRKNAELKYW